ncbi:MAG TPA: Rrf2 family transcriptional regulator [Bryobacteraceae bacterium]|nr:Rrf2 family transcriptional regulator [Bryobacteraceae bacterium]
MAAHSVQFAVATHIMTALGFRYGEEVSSGALARSVNADATFVRKSLSKLAKAGLVFTSRGKNGACALARPPREITLRDIYLASEAPAAFTVHSYPVERTCPVSANFKDCMSAIQNQTQRSVEAALSTTTLADVIADIRRRTNKAQSRPRRAARSPS